jgi:peroxiredoxin
MDVCDPRLDSMLPAEVASRLFALKGRFLMTGRMLRRSPLLFSAFCVCLSLQAFGRVRLDGLRNLKTGEPVPSVSLEVMDQGNLSTTSWQGHVTIVVCLASAQRHSELAAMESRDSGVAFASKGVKVYHVTTQVSDRELFRTFRTERRIEVPFIVDSSRAFTDAIGIIVLPTTLVLRKDGTLAHVISMHANDYRERLDAYVRHALDELSDAQLEETLKARRLWSQVQLPERLRTARSQGPCLRGATWSPRRQN